MKFLTANITLRAALWSWSITAVTLLLFVAALDVTRPRGSWERIAWLAVACVVLGMAASVVCARQLARPILNLRSVVTRVAEGDLTARAIVESTDELGALALSCNKMTEAMARQDRIFQEIRFAAEQFLSVTDWRDVLGNVLARMASAVEVERIAVYEIVELEGVGVCAVMRQQRPMRPGVDGSSPWCLGEWAEDLRRGQMISGPGSSLPTDLKSDGATECSFLALPVMAHGSLWGILCLVEAKSEWAWSPAEEDSFRAVANMLGAAITRRKVEGDLLESKNNLEARVAERTKALTGEILERQRAHATLADTQSRLLQASHQAGMAEVATGVLHNVGNVLNSINVSVSLLRQRVENSETASLEKVAALIEENQGRMTEFLAADPRGKMIPRFLIQVSKHMAAQDREVLAELEQMSKNVGHVKEIVSVQQSYARVSGVVEDVKVEQLMEDALQINKPSLDRRKIEVIRDYSSTPLVTVDKHKTLQILINLIRNARFALDSSPEARKEIKVGVRINGGGRVKLTVADNGIGIPAENLTRIFSHGFTTRKDGHGFGLHSGANAAREMGGLLNAYSDGPGKGAIFTLELPIQNKKATA